MGKYDKYIPQTDEERDALNMIVSNPIIEELGAGSELLDRPPPPMAQGYVSRYNKAPLYHNFTKEQDEYIDYFDHPKLQGGLGITMTFREYMRQNYDYGELRATIKAILKDVVEHSRDKKKIAFALIPEMSDTGHFHYHGMINGLSKLKINELRKRLNYACGYSKIEYLRNWWNWIMYISKDITNDPDNQEILKYRIISRNVGIRE